MRSTGRNKYSTDGAGNDPALVRDSHCVFCRTCSRGSWPLLGIEDPNEDVVHCTGTDCPIQPGADRVERVRGAEAVRQVFLRRTWPPLAAVGILNATGYGHGTVIAHRHFARMTVLPLPGPLNSTPNPVITRFCWAGDHLHGRFYKRKSQEKNYPDRRKPPCFPAPLSEQGVFRSGTAFAGLLSDGPRS